MEKIIAKMKIGERLEFGRYSVAPDRAGAPIIWLKASKDCDFIAADVIDYMCFDAPEPEFRYGNADYLQSNILSYLNSESDAWFIPTHLEDQCPTTHKDHVGFLYYFDDYELASLVEKEGSLIRLPAASDIVDDETKFSLFKQKGVRTKMATDCSMRYFINNGAYSSYWLRPEVIEGAATNPYNTIPLLGRDGKVGYNFPSQRVGVRPVCTIKPSLSVKNINDTENVFCITPFETNNNACTDDELMDFLGVDILN